MNKRLLVAWFNIVFGVFSLLVSVYYIYVAVFVMPYLFGQVEAEFTSTYLFYALPVFLGVLNIFAGIVYISKNRFKNINIVFCCIDFLIIMSCYLLIGY